MSRAVVSTESRVSQRCGVVPICLDASTASIGIGEATEGVYAEFTSRKLTEIGKL